MAAAAFIAATWTSVETAGAHREMANQTAEQRCEERREGTCKSLEADIRSALAAEAAADLAMRQVWISFIGLMGLGATVFCARAAWVAAQRSANTADETLKATRLSERRQLRAYVHVSECSFADTRQHLAAFVNFRNYGQTPAHDVWIERAASVRDYPLTEILAPLERYDAVFDLAPTGESNTMVLPFAEWDDPSPGRFGSGGTALYIHGIIHYRDAFDEAHETKFRLYVRSQTDTAVRPADGGNQAT
ncbi:hypothetical protein [Phenylobacterium sp.]|uniref:hypothetical protein n=1 Tax=Phenylobacterium sp. TaxID=1871053 RepID=UPI003BA8C065